MLGMNKFRITGWLISLCLPVLPVQLSAAEQVTITVNWALPVGDVTANHWGVNDFQAKNQTTFDKPYSDYLKKVSPGILRIHQAGLVNAWTDNVAGAWDTAKIKQIFDNIMPGYGTAKVLLDLSDWPEFIAPGGNYLPLDKEQALEDYFAQLPAIIKSIGHRVDYYEFLNENDEGYQNSIGFDKYAQLVKRLAIRVKAEALALDLPYTVKVGGPALRWPNIAWYQPAIDILGAHIDFFSWHHYAAGPIGDGETVEQRNQAIFNSIDWMAGSAVNDIRNYAVSKGYNHLEYFLDEFSLQWVWTPYEPRVHNNVGAVWFASLIKRFALNNLTGAMVWNAKDGAYGLLPDNENISAPGQLYLWGNKYLRGQLMTSGSSSAVLEVMPVLRTDNSHQVLLINRSTDTIDIDNINTWMGIGATDAFSGLSLDASCREGNHWEPKPAAITGNSVKVMPWSVVLITNSLPEMVVPVADPQAVITMHDRAYITWADPNTETVGFNIYINGNFYKTAPDTACWVENLQPDVEYTIGVSVLDQFWQEYDTVTFPVSTENNPLFINDQTIGTQHNMVNWSSSWLKGRNPSFYNADNMAVTGTGSSFEVDFTGHQAVIIGQRNISGGKMKILIDGEVADTLDFSIYPVGTAGNDYGVLWSTGSISPGNHTLVGESVSTGEIEIDAFVIFGDQFATDNTAPAAVSSVSATVSFKTISLDWPIPADNTGIQGYRIQLADNAIDTVYSPAVLYEGLQPSTQYLFSIEAFDVAGNLSEKYTTTVSTDNFVYFSVRKAATAPTIDGNVDAVWEGRPRYTLSSSYGGSTETSAWFSLLWDRNYLYLLLTANDQYATPQPSSVEVFLDCYNDKGGSYSSNDFWYTFNRLASKYSEAYNGATSNNKFKAIDGEGFVFEASFKWSVLKVPLADTNFYFGLEVHLTDSAVNPAATLTWMVNSSEVSTNNSLMANLRLSSDTSTTNVIPVSEVNWQVCPNPVTNTLFIAGTDIPVGKYKICDLFGRQFKVGNIAGVRSEIDVSDLAAGYYCITLANAAGVSNLKFIKK